MGFYSKTELCKLVEFWHIYTNYRNCADDEVDRSLEESQYSGT